MAKRKRRYKGARIVAEEITQGLERTVDIILEKHPEAARKMAEDIAKAVKKYILSGYTDDDGVTLYNELMDAMEIVKEDKTPEFYPQQQPGIDF